MPRKASCCRARASPCRREAGGRVLAVEGGQGRLFATDASIDDLMEAVRLAFGEDGLTEMIDREGGAYRCAATREGRLIAALFVGALRARAALGHGQARLRRCRLRAGEPARFARRPQARWRGRCRPDGLRLLRRRPERDPRGLRQRWRDDARGYRPAAQGRHELRLLPAGNPRASARKRARRWRHDDATDQFNQRSVGMGRTVLKNATAGREGRRAFGRAGRGGGPAGGGGQAAARADRPLDQYDPRQSPAAADHGHADPAGLAARRAWPAILAAAADQDLGGGQGPDHRAVLLEWLAGYRPRLAHADLAAARRHRLQPGGGRRRAARRARRPVGLGDARPRSGLPGAAHRAAAGLAAALAGRPSATASPRRSS
jgi:hypothetical protein